MEHLAPLLQTILWVALLTGVLYRFHAPIHGILTALQRRIESGSNIKAGPFELNNQVRSQDITTQVERVDAEFAEILHEQEEKSSATAQTAKAPQAPQTLRSELFEAEDLALRAIQLAYNTPVTRQVTLEPHVEADAVFTVDGELNIVEVKHFLNSRRALPTSRKTLDRFRDFLRSWRWKRVKVVLAVVLHNAEDVEYTRRQLSALKDDYEYSIDVHCYSLQDLRTRFGL